MKATEDVINVLCNLETEQGCEAHFKTFEVLKILYIYICIYNLYIYIIFIYI